MKSHLLVKFLLLTVFTFSLVEASDSQNSTQTRTRYSGTTPPPRIIPKPTAQTSFLNPKQTISNSFGGNDTLNQVFEKDTTGIRERTEKVRNARKLMAKGEIVKQTTTTIGDTVKTVGKLSPSSIPKTIGTVTKTLGTIVGGIIQGVARYRGNQIIQSIDEQLVRGIEDSFAKIEEYSEQLEELSPKRPTLKPGDSLTDKYAFSLSGIKGSIQDLLDKTYLTDFKGKRIEEARPIQQALKLEKENFEDLVRLLQIKLIEFVIKEKMAELHPDQTQFQVERDLATLQEAKKQTIQRISQMDPVKNKTERAELILTMKDLEQKVRAKQTELNRLLNTHLTQEQIDQLEEEIATLRKEVKPIYEMTRLYQARVREGSVKQECCPEEFQSVQDQIDSLKEEVGNLRTITEKQTEEISRLQNVNKPNLVARPNQQGVTRRSPPLPHQQQQIDKPTYRWQPPSQQPKQQTTF